MTLPQDFINKYIELLQEEAPNFLDSFSEAPVSGFRSNPLKENQIAFDNPIPKTEWGYYGKISGKSVEHVTGLVYSQEPAAQMVGQVAKPKPGMKVLDLAAAPGGKTTHLLSYLNNTGLLISNEINTKRSKILTENVERFGARNVLVTNESAERLAKIFPSYFDLIVFDGPCSGEGMFRKDPEAEKYWHKDYPKELASLQKSILSDALAMLAPGGELVYSTCTWSPEENEEVVEWLLEEFSQLELIPIRAINGMRDSDLMPGTVRMYPHSFKGEGQFIAKFKDVRPREEETKLKQKRKARQVSLTKEQMNLWESFSQEHLKITLEGQYQVFGDQLYIIPAHLPDLSQLKIARNGLHLGTFKKKRFEPSFALGIALKPSEVVQKLEIDIEQFKEYVAGSQVNLHETYSNGWYQVVINGNGLGFAKVVGNQLKNFYPKGLRFK
ncbi:RsmF rRNA methyltransferase first C-terminal domain-containing protein [Streptococcus pluranimalium]|uniref:RNA methyltransferase n=1 Tax=Streptococcus pluranimalium TaxID=82348 RepID=A0A2L0D4J9_9STRE|nr:RsmB/NOP family class I SAM-dependent RNA methyltransferase [Streptococcus pluranimalium]AUW96570.1 RNA methyltransferase [Streptococcus pluranimalium]